MPPILRQLALQFAAVIIVASLLWPLALTGPLQFSRGQAAMATGLVAVVLAWLTRQPMWWRVIHLFFLPAAAWALTLSIDPAWYLAAAIVMALVFRGAASGQVPLYLSNTTTVTALDRLISELSIRHFTDLGCGLASVLAPLAQRHPERRFTGVENAPLSWIVARLRALGQNNLNIHYRSLWQQPLHDCDAVYAFLSPAPMAALWQHLCQQTPGGWLISNSFAVPDISPARTIVLDDRRGTTLYLYRIPSSQQDR